MFHAYYYVLLVGVGALQRLPLASGSVYPTQPVQATVWTADTPSLVSWIEDWTYPTLEEMGPLAITLWCDSDTYLAELASNVDPLAKKSVVRVPAGVLRQGSKYTLRLTTSTPIETVVYSADFVITMLPANATNAVIITTGPAGATTLSNGGSNGAAAMAFASTVQSGGTGVMMMTTTAVMSGTTTTTLTPTPGSAAFTTNVPLTTLKLSARPSSSSKPSQQQQRGGATSNSRMDVEKLKFRFVFVIWPVLMGITMAL